MWGILFLIYLAFVAYSVMTKQGQEWWTKTWAWWNPTDFKRGIINGKALKRKKHLDKLYLDARIKANKERVAKRRRNEELNQQSTTRMMDRPFDHRDIAAGGFHTGMPGVEVRITGGVTVGPDHLDTRRAGERLRAKIAKGKRVEKMIAVLDEKQREHIEAAEGYLDEEFKAGH